MAHSCGYRFRLHRKDLPGKPDLVFPRHKAAIFVHGCFWHMHDCEGVRTPKSNTSYWRLKLERNRMRDEQNVLALKAQGWKVLVIWECEMGDEAALESTVKNFLSPSRD